MKTREYLHVIVHPHDAPSYINELQLKEVHLVTKMAKENERLVVSIREVHIDLFNTIFGL